MKFTRTRSILKKAVKTPALLAADIYRNRKLAVKLAFNDFKVKYAGSYFGTLWAFVQPVVTILVYWFVFSVGFRASTGEIGVPFVLYLVAGIIPWFFFSDGLVGGTSSLIEYHYLVKKVVFNISVLPVVKLLSALLVHGFFVAFTLLLYSLYGRLPDLYTLQLIYYCFCTACLCAGICYASSAIAVLFRDLIQIVQILLQVGIWLTPIMWIPQVSLASHPVLHRILKLNPVYYIVSGYRDCFLFKQWFWEHPFWTGYFWLVTLGCFSLGSWVFGRLKVHFADVL